MKDMIRQFQQKDIERIMQIWLAGNIEAHDFVPKDYWVSNYSMVKEQILQANIYVYETSGEVQGFVGMVDDYIAGIFVEKEYRSAGIGQKLLDYSKKKHASLMLEVYAKNKRAIEFYLREGFSVSAEITDEETGKISYKMSWNINR